MKKTMFFAMGLFSVTAIAQTNPYQGRVGINTETPSASMNIKSKDDDKTPKNLELENQTGTKLVTVLNNGNVGIGTENPSQKLDVVGKVKITDGTQGIGKVLTSDANGNASWQNVTQTINNNVTYSVTSQVDYNILGYVPNTTATANTAPVSVSYGGKTATKWGTHTFNGNGHSYATFLAPEYLSWYEAYEMAKEMGGYLATFTTDEEWKSVETALLEANRTFDTTGAWIGMARFEWFAGSALQPTVEMKWITGELPRHDYSARGTRAVRKSNWFTMQYYPAGYDYDYGEDYDESWGAGTEPNNAGGREGFVHTWPKNQNQRAHNNGYTSNHSWNDIQANYQSSDTNVKSFIVEFQQ